MVRSNSCTRRRNAFSLIEMMIVLLVISILLAIAIPAYMNIRESSRARACMTNLRQIQSAKERWAMDNKKHDQDKPQMSDLAPAYMKRIPTCPSSGQYRPGSVSELPTCSIGGTHAIQ